MLGLFITSTTPSNVTVWEFDMPSMSTPVLPTAEHILPRITKPTGWVPMSISRVPEGTLSGGLYAGCDVVEGDGDI